MNENALLPRTTGAMAKFTPADFAASGTTRPVPPPLNGRGATTTHAPVAFSDSPLTRAGTIAQRSSSGTAPGKGASTSVCV